MTVTSPTLDDAPPDWGAYSDTCQWWAEEVNRHREQAQAAQDNHQQAETAALMERGTDEFEDWLRGEG